MLQSAKRPLRLGPFKSASAKGDFLKIRSFVLMGVSKRGHTCWHTAAVDNRAARQISGIRRAFPNQPRPLTNSHMLSHAQMHLILISTDFCLPICTLHFFHFDVPCCLESLESKFDVPRCEALSRSSGLCILNLCCVARKKSLVVSPLWSRTM